MTLPVYTTRVVLGLTVTVPDEVIEANLGYLPWLLGDGLAAQVDEHVSTVQLGYFPALDYFRDPARDVDPALLTLIDQMAQFSVEYTRRELRRRLSRVFSHVQIDQAQCTAYTLPRVRPGQPQALADLGKHYTPSRVKLELVLSTIEKIRIPDPDLMAISKVQHWAAEPFASLDILGARVVSPTLRDEAG